MLQYHGLFPRRQLWRPTLEYPLWDYNWDGRKPPPIIKKESSTEDNENGGGEKQMTEGQRDRYIRKNGVTRHIIMIRHGQYDETHKVSNICISYTSVLYVFRSMSNFKY